MKQQRRMPKDLVYDDFTPPCKHNPGVGCYSGRGCAHCGWNPAEAGRRVWDADKRKVIIKKK